MRIKKLLGPVILIVILLFVTATYVAYMDKVELMRENGVWDVSVSGAVYLSGGSVYAVIDSLKAQYDAYPEVPTYSDYLGDIFDSHANTNEAIDDNQTFVEVRILITSEGKDLAKKTLLDKTLKIAYLWAGGDYGSDGKIASYSYDLGPYIAYQEYSPYKIICEVTVDGKSIKETKYLTIPVMEGV